MKATEITRRYHEAWNGRDADALVATFTKDGTFCNPDTYPGVSVEALAAYVKALWTAFPDFHVEVLNAGEIEPGLSLTIGECKAPTRAKEPTAVNPPDAPSP
jgi:SnoaL-like domain